MKKGNHLSWNLLAIFCFLLCTAGSFNAKGQACGNSGPGTCNPASGLTGQGFYPSDTSLPCAADGQPFSQVISFVAPTSVDGYSLQYIQVAGITNLPCGLCWSGNSSIPVINGGTAGCILISGITNEVPGQYNVVVYATATVSTPIGNVTVGPLNIDSAESLTYYIRVIDSIGGNCPPIAATGGTASTPGTIIVPTISGNTSVCSGGTTTLSATGATYYAYKWNNGTYGSSINVGAGTYSVTVYDNCASASATVNVTNSSNTAVITPQGPTTFCQGGSVTLKAANNTSYLWSTGATTQSITVTQNGSCSVIVTSSGGCRDTSASTVVTVNPLPTPSISSSGPTAICDGGKDTLTASTGASYQWSTNAVSQSIVVSTAGSYTVTVTNNNGCSAATSPTVITVSPPSTATITASGPTSFCAGGSVTLTASAGNSYLWSTGATTASINVTQAGNYAVTVTLAGGCLAVSSPTTVSINSQPATITASGPTSFCAGGSVTLTASPGLSYNWSTGATTQSITVNTAGSYTVSVTTGGGCQAVSAATVVSLSPAPTITASGPTTFSAGGSVTLTASAGTSYQWTGGATSQSINVTNCGVYTAIVYFPGGCASATAPVTVTVNP